MTADCSVLRQTSATTGNCSSLGRTYNIQQKYIKRQPGQGIVVLQDVPTTYNGKRVHFGLRN